MKEDDNMHDIEDLLFSFNGKIIAERNSNLASCTLTCVAARHGVELHISRLELHVSCFPQVLT